MSGRTEVKGWGSWWEGPPGGGEDTNLMTISGLFVFCLLFSLCWRCRLPSVDLLVMGKGKSRR